jgi:2-C-methyl-D-erythritol 4-phosphate cytidylyltransferase
MKVVAIIPAGGKGTRSGNATPKQYLKFNGKELIVYPLQTLQKCKFINEIIIAVESKYSPLLIKLKKKYKLTKVSKIVKAGKERQDSVFNALLSLSLDDRDFVVVHDAARALLPLPTLNNAIRCAKEKGNALVCLPAKDTLLKGKNWVETYVDRKNIFYVQTPQIFTFGTLKKAMLKAKKDKFLGTDESMLVKRSGEKINIVEGVSINFKITTKEDISLAKKLISNKS